MTSSSVSNSRSRHGGAISVSESVLKAMDIQISQCEAENDGGAIVGGNSSKMLCHGCTLVDNHARRGGAIFFEYNDTRQISMQLNNCTLQNNSAEYGGGIQVVAETESMLQECRVGWEKCKAAAIANTIFVNNEADAAGGAIFVDSVAGLRLNCSHESKEEGLGFFSKRQWKSMKILTSTEDICTTWTNNNSAGRYGPDVASYASEVQVKIEDRETGDLNLVNKSRHTIHSHNSGKSIFISLTAVDDLKHSPAVGMDNKDIEAVMSSPNGFFTGSVRVPLNTTVVNISTTEFVQPGEYQVLIEFEGTDLENFKITVEVRTCAMGEVPSGNGTFCERCSDATFSLFPDKDRECHLCPENGNCSTRVISPNRSYWHQTPCSEHIQRCLTPDACDSDSREGALEELTEEMETCDVDETFIKKYTEAQCREGHEGPLCGSCKESYGTSHSHLCEKCFSGISNVALVTLSLLVLLCLSSITIRSNLISVVSSPQQQQTEAAQSSAGSLSTHTDPVERTLEMTTVRGVQEEESNLGSSQETDPSQSPEDAELNKWKAVELLKIAVNFLQVMAIAVSVNVKWTIGLVMLFQTAEFASAIASEAVNRPVDCLIPHEASIQRSIASTLVDMLQPLVGIFIFAVFWLAIKIRRKKAWTYLLKRCILSALVVFYISYISITKTLVNIVNCVEVHDSMVIGIDETTDYWAVDTSIQCYEGSHASLSFLLAWPFLFIFTVGFPLGVAYLSVKKVADDYKDGWIYDIAGFIYRSYSQKYIFWESLIMFRKALLAVVVVFSYDLGSNIQAVLASFVLISALYFQTKYRPYRDEFDSLNDVESLSILLSSLTFVCSIFFEDGRVSYGIRVLMSVSLLCANILFIFYLLVLFVIYAAEYLKTVLVREGIHASPDHGTFRVLCAYFIHNLFTDAKDAMARWVNYGRSRRYLSPEV